VPAQIARRAAELDRYIYRTGSYLAKLDAPPQMEGSTAFARRDGARHQRLLNGQIWTGCRLGYAPAVHFVVVAVPGGQWCENPCLPFAAASQPVSSSDLALFCGSR